VACAITNDVDLGLASRLFHQFLSENKCSLLFRSLVEGSDDLTKVDNTAITLSDLSKSFQVL